ncbi:MAG: formyltransferase family protein [Myxococcota bacterium]
MSTRKVIFFGNGYAYSMAFLRVLIAHGNVEVVAIVSPVSDPVERQRIRSVMGRGIMARIHDSVHDLLQIGPDSFFAQLARLARGTDALLLWPERVNDPNVIEELEGFGADLGVMAGFNQIFKEPLLKALPPIINIHPSLLPLYRGPHPEFWIVADGAQKGGVTIHEVVRTIDAGAILAQSSFSVDPWLTCGAYQKRAIAEGELLLEQLLDQEMDQWQRMPQRGEGSYLPRVQSEHIRLPFHMSAMEVYNRSRACAPWMKLVTWVERAWWLGPLERDVPAMAEVDWDVELATLELSNAVPFPERDLGEPPGSVWRTEEGGLVVACNPGTVYFRDVDWQ